jgi:hypothetical protein
MLQSLTLRISKLSVSTLVPNSPTWRAAVCCDNPIFANCRIDKQQVQNILEQIHLPKKLSIFGDYSNYYTARFDQ